VIELLEIMSLECHNFKMYTKRTNQDSLLLSLESPFVTAILGPRQVGKSTLVAHYMTLQPEKVWVFLSMDVLLQRDQVEAGRLQQLIEEGAQQRIGQEPFIWVVIEEAQKCPRLFDQVKALYDQFKQRSAIKFILTGSAALSLHQLSAESLAGRIQLFYLQEFNLHEATSLQLALSGSSKQLPFVSTLALACEEQDIPALDEAIRERAPFRLRLMENLLEQLVWGGFPELLLLTRKEERIRYLSDYLHTYLEKDVRAITTITDLHLYRKLITVIAEQTGSVRQDLRIREALGGCHAETLKKYRAFLEATLLYCDVYPYIASPLKRLVKSPKGYLLSNGLISLITGIYEADLLLKSGLIGHRLENWFLKELQIWLARSPGLSQIDFWRTTGGVEVDFVVAKPPRVLPFEVTYSTQIDRKKLKNLQTFMMEEPKATIGYYIYNGEYRYDPQLRIVFLPAWSVC
jgi:predicted AAA+ superfamily ATPase